MQVPKLLVAAVVFAIVLVSAGFFLSQTAKPVIAQNSKITGTIVLHESESPEFVGGIVALPGSSCDVIIKQCRDSGLYQGNGLEFPLIGGSSYYIVPALYLPQSIPITFGEAIPEGDSDKTAVTLPTFLASNVHSVFGVNRWGVDGGYALQQSSNFCDGIIYDDLPVSSGSVFIVGQAYYASNNSRGNPASELVPPSYWDTHYGTDNAGIELTSLVVTYSCN